MTKVFSRMGTIAEDGLVHPFDETTQLTKGFAFINFLNPQDAKHAVTTLNGWQLDKSHNIKVQQRVIREGRRKSFCATCMHHICMHSITFSRIWINRILSI